MARRKDITTQKTTTHRGHKEGSIYKLKNGRWMAQVQVGIKPNGRRKFATKSGKTRKEVADWLVKIQGDVNRNMYVETTNLTVEEWFWTWMNIYKKHTISANTYTRYIYMMKIHIIPKVGKIKVKDLTTTHIQKLYNELYDINMAYTTRKHIHTLFNQALQCAVNEGILEKNVALNTIRPRNKTVEDEVEIFTKKEQEKILSSLDLSPLSVLIKTAIGTGCRLGELLGLTWDNVDLKNNVIHIVQSLKRENVFSEDGKKVLKFQLVIGTLKTKTSKRSIPIADSTVLTLKKYKMLQSKVVHIDNEYPNLVFPNAEGNLWDQSNVRKMYAKFLKSIDIPYRKFHALRHTYATRLMENGIHPKVAQQLLGHSDCTITMKVYSHVMPEQMKEAIEKIKEIV